MPSALYLSALLAATASARTGAASTPLDSLRAVHSSSHPALVSPSHKDSKWLVFPQQRELHVHSQSLEASSRSGESMLRNGAGTGAGAVGSSDRVYPDSFFQEHAEMLGVDQHAEFTKHHEFGGSGDVTHQRYHQAVKGIPVFGGDFHLTIGSHAGVLSAHGSPMKVLDMDKFDVSRAQRVNSEGVDSALQSDLLARAKQHILSSSAEALSGMTRTQNNVLGDVTTTHPIQVKWIRTGKSYTEGTAATLAYHIDAIVSNPFSSHDIFIDISTLEVVFSVDKTKRSSPFTSPIDTDIKVYDMFLKDYNDDVEDDDYSPDVDRGSNATKVFDTTESHSFPTDDQELNDLVDYTLYTAHLYNSLSNGQLPSWSSSLPFNIEFNLTIANAYFDGDWGIHFGTGFITDDVVVHEWAHAYTDQLANLVYMGESGAMNEAFSDIFGEGVDLLVEESTIPESELRSTWPLQCHSHVGVDGVFPAGTDSGFRWAMGENVSSGSMVGQLRDMYYPECHRSPGTVYSQYYVCSEYPYDGGGVHSNSGVLNRVFATLTDGGEYEDPSGGSNLVVQALGLTKTLNLFYQTEASLTQYSQFYDAAQALYQTCINLIGQDIYYPNVMNMTVLKSTEKIVSSDCTSVSNALTGSGMSSTENHCPNLECPFDTYLCRFISCDTSAEVVDNDFTSRLNTYSAPPCKNDTGNMVYPVTGTAKYARVFDQSDFSSASFKLGCVEYGFVTDGDIEATFEFYIDEDGGDPNDNMTLIASYPTTVINVGANQYARGTLDTDELSVSLSGSQTFVVVLSHALNESPEEFFSAGYGYSHTGTDRTFVGGSCISGFQDFASYCAENGNSPCTANWLVELSISGGASDGDDDMCFHVDSMIDYKGVEYTYKELLQGKEPECIIPHSPFSRGVVIATSCGKTARVTDTHLMATTKGFQLAYSLKVGDVLFGDYHEEHCTVTSVQKEMSIQKYFGLNCVHSEVLVSGLRASTFGDFHTLPSWYMTYVGGLVGSDAASTIGGYIAEWYFQK